MDEDLVEEAVINAAVHYANMLFGDDEDESLYVRERGRWVVIDVDIDSLKRLPDPTFQMHFRMSRPVFELLVAAVGNHLFEMGRLRRCLRMPLDVSLMMALWILATPDTFRSVAMVFSTSPGVVHFQYLVVIQALTEMASRYVTWPSIQERETIKDRVEQKSGFPGVIGFIDSTHLYFTAPGEDPIGYLNRHHSHSILAQVVCDDNYMIRDLYVGEPGSLHETSVFRRSPLSNNLLTKPDMIAPDEHLLGDGGYILTDKLLIPYRNNGHLTRAQRRFNRKRSGERATVERVFGLAECKWRRMKYFESHCVEYAVEHVVASFVLHNFVLASQDAEEVPNQMNHRYVPRNAHRDLIWEEDVDPAGDYPNVPKEPDHLLLAEARVAGVLKRRALTHYFETGALPN